MASERKIRWAEIFRSCLPRTRQRALAHPSPPSEPTPIHDTPPPTDLASTQAAPIPSVPPVAVTTAASHAQKVENNPVIGTLKSTLEALRSSLNGLPPLQLAVGGLLECIVHLQVEEQNRQAYEELASDLTNLASILQKHVVESKPCNAPYSIANVARAIGEQTNYIKVQQDRSQIGRLATAKGDQEAVLKCYRRIGALFQQLQTDILMSVWDDSKERDMDTRLKDLNPAYDAYHNAALPTSVTKRVGCTKGTRVNVLETARRWTREISAPKVYWLNGMAGTGKTTIAYTLCELLQKDNQLGASFFCSRNSPDCRDVNKIVPTIAYQLGRYSNPYRKALCDVLRNDPDAARRNIDAQFEQLILNPLAEMGNAMPDDVVVVVDALDECSDVNGTRQVLDLLFKLAGQLPLRFFVTSRPEPAISSKITSQTPGSRSIIHLHDIEQSLVQADIRTYLVEALATLQPSAEHIQLLTERAGRLFIFAATVVRYISPEDDTVDHDDRLSTMLYQISKPGSRVEGYEDLDELYSRILAKALQEGTRNETEMKRQVLWTVICAREAMNTSALAQLLGAKDKNKVELAIRPLQSVLHVASATGVVSALHASFPDFLLNEERSERFYCDLTKQSSYLAIRSFEVMRELLCFNICGLGSSYHLDKDIPDIHSRVELGISPGLFYSCRYWGDHLFTTTPSRNLLSLLEDFLTHRLLFWMEVLSLNRCIECGEGIFGQVLNWLPAEPTNLSTFAYDARNFVTTFAANPSSGSTPHIYISTLPFTPKHSLVWATYWPQTQGLIRVEGAAMERRGKSALATWDIVGMVYSIAQSSDGKRIVVGSRHNNVNIWDVSRGALVLSLESYDYEYGLSVALSPDGARVAANEDHNIRLWDAFNGKFVCDPLCGHTDYVYSVAFSPDGACLASGSEDHTIRMWDAHRGVAIGEIYTGHEGAVWSVAFSPNGEHLASGSADRTIRVWNWRTGVAVRAPIEGHSHAVRSVAYSPDGLRLASGSEDCTVRVWSMPGGTLLAGPFEDYTGPFSPISFSPDSTRIVSGPRHTVLVWEAETGNLLAGPFEGHDDMIQVALFTTDGTRVLSGSHDGTIRVWDTRHRTTGATGSTGHSGGIALISLSPDGTRIASGSGDNTICVWDVQSGALVAGPFAGHTDTVTSAAFSPDGEHIVSGSADCTLCIWDASTGTLLVGPIMGHTNAVHSVAFSPDGCQIASGSDDYTVRLWDSYTGASVAEPFRGHTRDVSSIAFSPDGARIVSCENHAVRMWDANNGIALWTLDVDKDSVFYCLAFSPDGARVVSGLSMVVVVLDAHDGAVLYGPFRGHEYWVYSVAFSPDGTRIVSGSRDRTVCVWDAESGEIVAGPLEGYTGRVYTVAFSPDGVRVVSSSGDHTIRFWDIAAATQSDYTTSRDLLINDDGWLTNKDSQLMLWVPPELRDDFLLPSPSTPIIIKDSCFTYYDSTLLLGDRWHECFRVSPPPAS